MNKGAIEEPLQAHSIVETYQEGLRLFMGQGELNQTLVRLVRNLEQHGIDYMVVGRCYRPDSARVQAIH